MKRRIALSLKLYLKHTILLQSIHKILKEKTFQLKFANAIFYRQCDVWHLSCDTSRRVTCEIETNLSFNHPVLNLYPKSPHHHLLVGQKPLLKPKYVWRQTTHIVASTSIRGWNLYPNRDDLIQQRVRTCLIWKIVLLRP